MHRQCVNTINEMARQKELARFKNEGFRSHDEHWIRYMIRLGSKMKGRWCRNGAYRFRYQKEKTYEWRTENGYNGVVHGDNKADAYAKLTHAIEQAIMTPND